MMQPGYSKTIESYVVRLAQKSRAAGIHLIIATQRPTSDVITGLIKANIPSRVCLKVTSAMESRIILDAKGGEFLTGYGDLLYKANGSYEAIRLQSCYISPDEMKAIGQSFLKEQPGEPEEEDGLTVAKRHQINRDNYKPKKKSFFNRFF
jgi:S-DNA-T family DNA segregation ATPase FtsK/SpoIIIE